MSAVPVWVVLRLVHVGLIDLMFPSEPACGADFQKLSCMAKLIRGWREALTQSSEAVGFRLYQREHELVPVLARAPRTQRVPTGGPPPSPSKEALCPTFPSLFLSLWRGVGSSPRDFLVWNIPGWPRAPVRAACTYLRMLQAGGGLRVGSRGDMAKVSGNHNRARILGKMRKARVEHHT